ESPNNPHAANVDAARGSRSPIIRIGSVTGYIAKVAETSGACQTDTPALFAIQLRHADFLEVHGVLIVVVLQADVAAGGPFATVRLVFAFFLGHRRTFHVVGHFGAVDEHRGAVVLNEDLH